jgi:hypothetical protein
MGYGVRSNAVWSHKVVHELMQRGCRLIGCVCTCAFVRDVAMSNQLCALRVSIVSHSDTDRKPSLLLFLLLPHSPSPPPCLLHSLSISLFYIYLIPPFFYSIAFLINSSPSFSLLISPLFSLPRSLQLSASICPYFSLSLCAVV